MRSPLPQHQRGIAVVALITLMGLALSMLILGAMRYTRSGQASGLALRTQTEAQMRAWTGLEAVRQYLANTTIAQNAGAFASASSAKPIPLTLNLPAVTANVTGYSTRKDAGGATLQVLTVQVTGSSTGANAVLEGVLEITPGVVTPGSGSNLLNFTGGLQANGGISFVGDPVNITVAGDFTTSTGVNGINQICATGSITLSGGSSSFKRLCANGDITLASVQADLVEAGSHYDAASKKTIGSSVTLSGAARIGTLYADGSAILASGSTVGDINVINNITMDGGSSGTGTFTANGAVTLTNGSVPAVNVKLDSTLNNTTITTLKSAASIVSNGATISSIAMVAKNYRENSYGRVAAGQLGGSILPGPNPQINLTRVPGLAVTIPVVAPRPVITAQIAKVDAYSYQSSANYVYSFDAAGNRIVTVNKVSGLADGSRYYLDTTGWMCNVNPAGGTCPATAQVARYCTGYWSAGNCLDGSTRGNWQFNGSGTVLAPGVVWFDGNLSVGNGYYFNSMIATGSISTSGNNQSRGINLSNYADVCANPDYPYPTNLCNRSTKAIISTTAGNLQFLAGSYKNGVFSGGTITLGSANELWGDVVAGDHLNTSGSTRLHGAISTSAQSGGGSNNLGGGTHIDLTGLPPGYTPGGGLGNGGNAGNTSPPSVAVRGVRYL